MSDLRPKGAELEKLLLQQVEYYFSKQNLRKDHFLQSRMDASFSVPIDVIASFNRILSLTTDRDILVKVMRSSPNLTVNDSGKRVRPNFMNTLVMRPIPNPVLEDLLQLFDVKKCPQPVNSSFEYPDSWIVTFETEGDCMKAQTYLRENHAELNDRPLTTKLRGDPVLLRRPQPNMVPMMPMQIPYGYYPPMSHPGMRAMPHVYVIPSQMQNQPQRGQRSRDPYKTSNNSHPPSNTPNTSAPSSNNVNKMSTPHNEGSNPARATEGSDRPDSDDGRAQQQQKQQQQHAGPRNPVDLRRVQSAPHSVPIPLFQMWGYPSVPMHLAPGALPGAVPMQIPQNYGSASSISSAPPVQSTLPDAPLLNAPAASAPVAHATPVTPAPADHTEEDEQSADDGASVSSSTPSVAADAADPLSNLTPTRSASAPQPTTANQPSKKKMNGGRMYAADANQRGAQFVGKQRGPSVYPMLIPQSYPFYYMPVPAAVPHAHTRKTPEGNVAPPGGYYGGIPPGAILVPSMPFYPGHPLAIPPMASRVYPMQGHDRKDSPRRKNRGQLDHHNTRRGRTGTRGGRDNRRGGKSRSYPMELRPDQFPALPGSLNGHTAAGRSAEAIKYANFSNLLRSGKGPVVNAEVTPDLVEDVQIDEVTEVSPPPPQSSTETDSDSKEEEPVIPEEAKVPKPKPEKPATALNSKAKRERARKAPLRNKTVTETEETATENNTPEVRENFDDTPDSQVCPSSSPTPNTGGKKSWADLAK